MTSAAPQPTFHCPRCGYDQRGAVSTWSDSCPLHGICTECGLEFQWSHVLQPEKFEPPWCVEYASRRGWVKACVSTYFRSWLPGRFWSRLRMSDRIRWLRLAAYLVALSTALVLAQYVTIQSSLALYFRFIFQAQLDEQVALLSGQPRPTELLSQDVLEHWPQDYRPHSSSEAELFLASLLASQQTQWDKDQAWLASNPRISHSVWYCLYEANIAPLRATSHVSVPAPGSQTVQYIAPIEMHSAVIETLASRNGRYRSLEVARHWNRVAGQCGLGFVAGLLIFLLLPVTFVLLPVSRRRAKVRWRHIGRVAVYGMFIPISAAALLALMYIFMLLVDVGLTEFVLTRTAWWFVPCASVIWWAFAIGNYLKMPHGLAVAILMAVLCTFALLGAAYIIAPDAVAQWLLTW